VLISRAKERCEIFTSMTDEDIDPEFASTRKGVFALKLFIYFARTGRSTLAEAAGRDHDEVFEAQVAEALQERGYQVHRNVGISGLFVDLAVADPERPDRYVLGIECDGASYQRARSARDRDRLREAVLRRHDWFIYRIWSIDWFRRPKEQLDRLIAAIETAKTDLAARNQQEATHGRPLSDEVVYPDDALEMRLAAVEEAAPMPAPYVEAVLSKPSHLTCSLHEAPTGILTTLAEQVVAVEGPVHIDEIIARIRDAWSVKRAGGRIQDAVQRAIAVAVRQHRLVEDGVFYVLPGAEPIVRERSAARSPTLRKPEALPPAEISLALVEIVSRNFGATEEQAILAVSRALGFKSTSIQLRDVIAAVLHELIDKAVLSRRETMVELGPNAPVVDRKPVVLSPIDRLIADGEHERLEFKQTLRWDVRQQASNKKLEDVVVKAIAAFANHEGGTLLIGVGDNGAVVGLEPDFACLGGSRDKFEVHITNLLNARFSRAFRATKVKIGFPELEGKLVCRLDVQRSRTPVYVSTADQSGAVAERLFVRAGNTSHEIPPSQIATFVKEHFD
jgi:very-short-patch-repair endonuclease